MALTLQDRYDIGLDVLGYKRDWRARTRKYHVWTYNPSPVKIYTGRGGSVRMGLTVASSTPVTEEFKRKLIENWKNREVVL